MVVSPRLTQLAIYEGDVDCVGGRGDWASQSTREE